MKRLLYIAFNDRDNQLFGVHAKMLSQCRAFEAYGYHVELIERKGADTIIATNDGAVKTIQSHAARIGNKNVRSILDKQNQIRDIKTYIRDKKYDACYIRYDFSDPGFIGLLKAIKQVCPKVALELPTYPYEDENRARLVSRMKLSVDLAFRKQLHKYVDFIVTFYDGYESLFGIPVQVIPNGFDFSTMSMVTGELQSDSIHIIAVSSMREWHGYERFLRGMGEYYQTGTGEKRNIVLHLVGNGREYGKYQALVEELKLQERVIMEGSMHGEKLDALYEKCAIGIDSLARHRSGIDVLSSLKSREYGAKGIPMINSCRIDIMDDSFPYLLRVSADEAPVNMDEVVAFYDRCFASGKTRQEVGKEIRDYVEARSGMKQTLAEVVKQFEQ